MEGARNRVGQHELSGEYAYMISRGEGRGGGSALAAAGDLEDADHTTNTSPNSSPPWKKGLFQFDLHQNRVDVTEQREMLGASFDHWDLHSSFSKSLPLIPTCQRPADLDWHVLSQNVKRYGVRNAHLTAQPPQVGWSRIFNTQSSGADLAYSNVYVNKDRKGEFWVVNARLVEKLRSLNLWTELLANDLRKNGGDLVKTYNSIKSREVLSDDKFDILLRLAKVFPAATSNIPDVYKIAHSAARAPYLDQAESFNNLVDDPAKTRLLSSTWLA
ncbi:unnamed protein product [Amoebophrya sp. A25]|nr:unnamed protein product [Amoebophrya sp. A25]|eukprot:GSA25T00017678001.1